MAKSKKTSEAKKLYTQVQGNKATVFLYGIIGDEYADDADKRITDLDFIKTLDELQASGVTEIHLRINSPGGYTSDGLAIITTIKNSTLEIHTWNDGTCFSMAADIWLCVPLENRHMAKNATLMIHAPSSGCYGTAKDMRECANKLDAIAEATILMMSEASGKTPDQIRTQFYDYADHDLTYIQCVELGLVATDAETDYLTEEGTESDAPMKLLFHKSIRKQFVEEVENHIQVDNPILTIKKEEEMTTDALKTALGDGTLKLGDVESILAEEKAKQPLTIGDATKLVTEALAPVIAENTVLKQKVETLSARTFGTPPAAEGSSAEGANDPDAQKVDLREKLNNELKGKRFGGDDY